ncbi:peptide deformylase [Atopobacter phocae]|uniref:peptide deformylase n=1 Tax=Atopobacter phocae TaxID=136492 RepID=UPI00046EA948|nr:peptide deformylase [Atopobacter phocae]
MITMDHIIKEGHPTLREKAKKVEFPLTSDTKEMAEEMLTFLKNSQNPEIAEKYKLRAGVGLAAPQINKNLQIIAVHIPYLFEDEDNEEINHDIDTLDSFTHIMINPRILSESVQQIALSSGEGCLSVDRTVEGYVPRAKKIKLRFQDIEGQTHQLTLHDYEAIVVQHEIDHLNGIMFYDRIHTEDPFHQPKQLELL